MTVRRSADGLALARDQRMLTPERRARRRLHELGFRYVPAKDKERAWKGNHTSSRLLGGDCLIYLPPGYVLIDPDSPVAQELVERLELPRTLALGGTKGVRLLFRLPKGVVLRTQPRFLTDLDVIVDWFVAPGSQVEGHYYRVVDECEIAELPRQIAVGIELLQQPPRAACEQRGNGQRAGNRTFVCEDAMAVVAQKAADNRREQALRARGRTQAGARPAGRRHAVTGGADRRTDDELLAIDRDGDRHPALGALAARGQLRGDSCATVEQLIRRHPLGSKLEGKPAHWFGKCVWEPTERWLASQRHPRPAERREPVSEPGPRWVRRWRRHVAVPRVRQWQAAAERVLRDVDDERLRESYLALCALHADHARRYSAFGVMEGINDLPCYYLAFSVMRAHLDGLGGDAVARRLKRLVKLGLLLQLDRSGLVDGQASYYQLAIDGRPVLPPPPCSGCLSWPVTCGVARTGSVAAAAARASAGEGRRNLTSQLLEAGGTVPRGLAAGPRVAQPP